MFKKAILVLMILAFSGIANASSPTILEIHNARITER
jgi:hypothetical protein